MEIMKKYKAFTLAEVLITLAIIGVVAALTVPTVITNYKDKALEVQSKKAQSILTNGVRLLMAKDGVTELKNTKLATCDEDDKECIGNEIKRVFSVVADNISANDIFSTPYQFTSGSKPFWTDPMFKYVFITSDGMIFGVQFEGNGLKITSDVNGIKNPNKGSQDLCGYIIDNKGKSIEQCDQMEDWEETAVCDSSHLSLCSNKKECEAAEGFWDCALSGCFCAGV